MAKKAIKKTVKKAKSAAEKGEPKGAITKDMTIGEAVSKYPESAFVMMKHGLHCVGCHVAQWETIEQGAQGHGMDDATTERMVSEMNQAVTMMKKKK